MTSLAEVYADARNEKFWRLILGTGLFVAGAFVIVVAIVVATTDVLAPLGVGRFEAREIAGVFAGLGVPAVFVGIFTVLPARPYERAVAAIGASVAVFGVFLFVYAYPTRWIGTPGDNLTLPVAAIYFLGIIVTFWALFTAVVNFKTRNDPGGTVTLERTVEGETRKVEVPVSDLEAGTVPEGASIGGVGVVGDVDREPVLSATDDAEVESTPASDGGTSTDDLRTPGGAESTVAPEGPDDTDSSVVEDTDRYCGTCAHFEYVRTDDGIQPFCGFHDEYMDDMDACDRWTPNY